VKKVIFIWFLLFPVFVLGQYRDTGIQTTSVKEGIISESPNYLFGFLNTDNFVMRHSISMSYSSFAGQGVALGMYTNSMFYRLMTNLNVQMDISIVHSPYSTLGETFQKNISGIYISNAAINYRPWKDVSIHLQYRGMPYGYGGYYNPVFSPFVRGSSLLQSETNSVFPVD
jgi:hypothetical protein